jgi:TIR domain
MPERTQVRSHSPHRTPTILVLGLYESVIARRLVSCLKERGLEVEVFSPQAGLAFQKDLYESLSGVDFAVVVSPSEFRTNLFFELGCLVGALGPGRVLVVTTAADDPIPFDLRELPMVFLPQAGTVETNTIQSMVDQIERLVTALEPRVRIEERAYYSCFLSYSAADSEFVSRLSEDLTVAGVPTWLDSRDLKGGSRFTREIYRALDRQDKLLLVLSRASVRSQWVEVELRHAMKLEKSSGREIIFPLRIDGEALFLANPQVQELARERHVLDFENWTDESHYRRSLKRLTRDLTVSVAAESGPERL